MLNLICGPSGSGKSALITEMIRRDIENGTPCYLLVPEQQAYISERDLPKKLPANAGLYFKIVNFTGLCRDVFQKFGGVTELTADRTARAVLMWEAIRSLDGVLEQYAKSSKSDAALTESMLGAIEELQNCGVESAALEEVATALPKDSPLAAKLRDLSAIKAAYTVLMEERFGESSPDRLFRLAKTLRENDFFSGAKFYVDSFTGFTKPEYAVLTEVIRQCASVTVGLCTDSPDSRSIHFYGINETAKRLKKCAALADSPTRVQHLTNESNCRPQALRVLERDLWRLDLPKEQREELPNKGEDCVFLLSATNLYEESEAAALNILDLVQNGMHYGDIAVFVRDPERYRGVLDAALERHGIPCFFSDRTELSSKPLARLILSALRAVGCHYRTQDVITLVKTGLCGVSERDAALFEEYCETWKISGSRFLDSVWNMNPDGFEDRRSERADEILETANRVREAVILPLAELDAGLRESKRLVDRLRAVYDYLCRIELPARLSALAENELSLGQVREAGESLRLYDLVTDSFLLLCRLLPNAEVTVPELLALLEIVFSNSDLGSVPGMHDCVLVGSAATARAEGIRAALLLGLSEGDFPKAVQDTGILNGIDKKILQEYHLDLEADPKLQSAEELFYVYRAITKPLEKLYLSYSVRDAGSIKPPSLAMQRVCFLTDRKPKAFYFASVLQVLSENTEKTNAGAFRIAGAFAEKDFYLSKSKINAFMKCPYSFYCKYALDLRERKEAVTTQANDGTFIHFVFEKFLKRMAIGGEFNFPTEPEEIEAIVGEIVLEYLKTACPIPLSEMDTRLLHLFSRLQALAVAMMIEILAEIRNKKFQPAYFEESLGKKIPDLTISLSDGHIVHLSGTIDRIDLYQKDGQSFVRVIDYKTGSTSFKLSDVKSGNDMQLVFYLYAASKMDAEHFVPAGAYYLCGDTSGDRISIARSGFFLDDPALEDETPKKSKSNIRMSRAEIEALIREACDKIAEISESIFSGNAEKKPSQKACRYCIVRESCDVADRSKYY